MRMLACLVLAGCSWIAPEPAKPGEPVARETHPPRFYCTASDSGHVGTCARTAAACKRARTVLVDQPMPMEVEEFDVGNPGRARWTFDNKRAMSACAPQERVVCFSYV